MRENGDTGLPAYCDTDFCDKTHIVSCDSFQTEKGTPMS